MREQWHSLTLMTGCSELAMYVWNTPTSLQMSGQVTDFLHADFAGEYHVVDVSDKNEAKPTTFYNGSKSEKEKLIRLFNGSMLCRSMGRGGQLPSVLSSFHLKSREAQSPFLLLLLLNPPFLFRNVHILRENDSFFAHFAKSVFCCFFF
jgi:hypothetical protein